MPNGALAKQASTANLLIPSSLIKMGIIRFDPVYNFSGSEDTDLCFRLRKKGINIRFAKDAIIYEVQHPERIDSNYIDSRFIKDVANYSLVIRRNSTFVLILWRFFTVIVRIIINFPFSFFRRSSSVKVIAYSRSLIALIFGKVWI
jgi:GT2 family glycosyltransferase